MEGKQAITFKTITAVALLLMIWDFAVAAPRLDFSVTNELRSVPTITDAERSLASCISALPAGIRGIFREPSRRRDARLSKGDREKWRECAERERDLADEVAIEQLAADLLRLVGDEGAGGEARAIASALVQATRANAAAFRMVGSPFFNNFLVTFGFKEKGYCYHWVEALFKALPPQPFRYYERHWGGAGIGGPLENNAVIITKRGAPVTAGIVYDVWRSAGRPWWRPASEDHYKWVKRYNESEVISEYGTVAEGK